MRQTTAGRTVAKGKVGLLPFPFDDLSATKVRPAVCLTEAIGPHRHGVVAFITSQLPESPLATDVVLGVEHPDFGLTGLRVPSALRLHRLMTVTEELIRRELGHLSEGLQQDVSTRLRRLFAC